MKKKRTGIRYRILASVLFFMAIFVFWPSVQGVTLADLDTGLTINVIEKDADGVSHETVISGSGFVMRSKSEVFKLSSSSLSGSYKVVWNVESGTDYVDVTASGTAGLCEVKAKAPGDAVISARVVYLNADGSEDTSRIVPPILCRVYVRFAILPDASLGFVKVAPTDERESLVIKGGIGTKRTLALNFGKADSNECTWTSGDEDVVTVSKGEVTVVGAGHTTIKASYLPDSSVTPMEDSIDVYVIPKLLDGADEIVDGTDIYVHSDVEADCLTTNTAFSKNGGSIKDKLEWVITAEGSGGSQIIEDSLGYESSDLIELVPALPNQCLKVVGKAGIYNVRFFPKGIYKKNKEANVPLDKLNNYCKIVTLNILGEFEDKTIYVNKGDSFDIPQAFNVTKEVFDKLFTTTLVSGDTVIDYQDARGTAMEVGDAFIDVRVDDKTRVEKLLHITIPENMVYKITVHVSDGIKLDRTSVTIAVGAKLQLKETTGASDGTFTWTTSDEQYVTVNENGLIEGKRITKDNQDIVITLTQVSSKGNIRRATCKVRVVSTVTNIRLNYEKVDLEVDKTITVLATFTPNISTAPITWITNEKDLVDISVANDKKSIIVTGKKPGTAVITAVNTDNFVTASVTVRVVAPIKSIKLDATELTLPLTQEIVRLKATYEPKDATSTDLIWSTSSTAVANVDQNGVVTLFKAGTAVISVRPAYNPYLTMAQCTITVLQSATGFSVDKAEMTLEVGDTSTLGYIMNPVDATSKVTFRSMDDSIATVSSNGKVTAVAPGKTYIVASTDNGFSATCMVIVTKAASGVTLDVYHLTVAVGDTYQVIATPNPYNSTEKTFSWKSKDPEIATVNASGKVTGIKAGETIITIKTKKGDVEYLYVTVYDEVTSMKLNYTKKTIYKGKKFTLKPVFTPANATNRKVNWSSSNSKVVSVTSKGVVSGLRGGVAVVTGVSEDGGHVAACIVTVKQPVTMITLNKSSYTLGIGKTIQLKATVKSTYSSNQTLKWTSSNVKVATVSKRGVVTGKKLGTVTIKCSATDGSGEYATCKIRVVRQATKIVLNKTTMKMLVGETTRIRAKVVPSNATYKTVKWSSSDEKVAAIDSNGNITALGVGSCKIIASAKDNSKKKAYCLLYVSKSVPSTGVTISEKDMVLVKGTSSMLAYSISPNNTTDKVRFYSDNKKVATVSSTGRVSARKPGAATITVRTSSGKVGMVNVTVVGLNRTNITVGQYERIELWVEEISTGVKWYSENASIASVENGSVVSRKKGKTRIVAIVDGIRLYCNVTVK